MFENPNRNISPIFSFNFFTFLTSKEFQYRFNLYKNWLIFYFVSQIDIINEYFLTLIFLKTNFRQNYKLSEWFDCLKLKISKWILDWKLTAKVIKKFRLWKILCIFFYLFLSTLQFPSTQVYKRVEYKIVCPCNTLIHLLNINRTCVSFNFF